MSSNDSSFVSYTTLAVLAAGLAGGYAINKMVSPSPSTAAPPHSAKGPTASTSSLSPPSSSAAASSGLSKKKKKAPSPSTSPAAVVQPLLDQATAAKDQLVAVTSTAVKQAQANPAVQRAVQGAKEVVESAVETVQQAATTAAGGAATTASKKKKKGKKGTTTPPAPAAAAEAEAAKTAPSFKAAVAPVNSDGESKTAAAKTLKLVGGKVGADPSSLLKVPGQGQQEEESGSGWESAASIDNEDEGSWDTVKTKSAFHSSLSLACPPFLLGFPANSPLLFSSLCHLFPCEQSPPAPSPPPASSAPPRPPQVVPSPVSPKKR